ncbi:unnamed protein product [Adineta steineri]|uniref:Uncharacterized protein n=1 Tax=Adineta steineri TaxID=433720 RepID=A0A820FWB3_9BILA|nr:unnamed protein product [Adineta steineri]
MQMYQKTDKLLNKLQAVNVLFINNIQQVYQELIVLIRDQYSEEDLQIIGCPSQEQISLLISTSSSK